MSPWGKEAVIVAESLAQVLGIKFTHVVCSHDLGKNAPLRDRQDYRWNDHNRSRLDALLAMTSPSILTFTASVSPQAYPHTWICMAEGILYSILYIECSAGICSFPEKPSEDFRRYVELLSHASRLCDALYGFVTQMQADSWPAFHFTTDWEVPDMTPKEAEDLDIWYEQRDDYWRKVRGVYWGNLLSAAHLSQLGGAATFARNIAAIVGTDLVARLDDDKVFFMLPDMADSRIAVQRLFASAGLLMQAPSNNEAPEYRRSNARRDAAELGPDRTVTNISQQRQKREE